MRSLTNCISGCSLPCNRNLLKRLTEASEQEDAGCSIVHSRHLLTAEDLLTSCRLHLSDIDVDSWHDRNAPQTE